MSTDCKNYLDTYYKINSVKERRQKLLPLPTLKKSVLEWVKIHRGSYVGDLHDFLIFNYRSKSKEVTGDRITNCLKELKRERMIRVHKFELTHRYATLYSVNKRKGI